MPWVHVLGSAAKPPGSNKQLSASCDSEQGLTLAVQTLTMYRLVYP